DIDGVRIDIEHIHTTKTENYLVAEGAGGLLVPLNDQHTILDIMSKDYKTIVVTRHYLGSIKHTLLTVNLLKQQGFDVALIFSGNKHPTTEEIIATMTKVTVID